MQTRWRKPIVALMLVGLLVAGTSAFGIAKTYTIDVVVHGGIADPFWKVVQKGVEDAAASYPDLKVNYIGPASFDLPTFIADVEAAIASKPDALVCTLTAPEAMDGILRPAIANGLPVIAINAPDLRPPDQRIPVLTYIGEDSYFIGVTAATETLKRFTPKRAIYLNHHPGARNIEERGAGYIDTMKKHGIPAEQVNITADPIKGAEVVAAYIKTHPDTDAIFCGNTQRTETIIPRLEADGVKVGTDVKIAQMDISPKILDYIKQGKIMFTLDQEQYLQGYLGVLFAYLKVKFALTPPPAPISTGPAVITAQDIPQLMKLAQEGYR